MISTLKLLSTSYCFLFAIISFVFAYGGLIYASLSKVTATNRWLVGHIWVSISPILSPRYFASNRAQTPTHTHTSWLANLCCFLHHLICYGTLYYINLYSPHLASSICLVRYRKLFFLFMWEPTISAWPSSSLVFFLLAERIGLTGISCLEELAGSLCQQRMIVQ